MARSIVIGGTRGIGQVIFDQLVKRGDFTYRVSRTEYPDSSSHIKFDITSPNTDLLVNQIDANINYLVFSHRYRGIDWHEEFEVTVRAVSLIVEALISKFTTSESSVVIIGSNASRFVVNEQSAQYHASRASLESLTKYFAVKYGKNKVRFNCILPCTLIKPENQDFFIEGNQVRKMIEGITPLGRMGSAEDIANLVEFLCSDRSSFITGQSFVVDGGLSLKGQESIARELVHLQHKNTK
ncbi:SDR family NAD(P)-dependent oxidoreductase [Cylindrospermopsis raciborskii]|uniref:SDR family NAD(P)-dependent oxidoreductase n=1 Tax=Cylindrospermopsis raciborskii TaxID=77022 RepID=UPI001BA84D3E|nr:SDR family oxidoreductase [Cylindrospermopsis raciborskii]